jgi:hypothetical protein
MVVPGKILANRYKEFVRFLKNCPFFYHEEVTHINDLEHPDIVSSGPSATIGMAPPSAYPLGSPPEKDCEECLGIPRAQHTWEAHPAPQTTPTPREQLMTLK